MKQTSMKLEVAVTFAFALGFSSTKFGTNQVFIKELQLFSSLPLPLKNESVYDLLKCSLKFVSTAVHVCQECVNMYWLQIN